MQFFTAANFVATPIILQRVSDALLPVGILSRTIHDPAYGLANTRNMSSALADLPRT